MAELKHLETKKDFKRLEELTKFNAEEKVYWKDVCKKEEKVNKDNLYAVVAFYKKELEKAEEKFKNSGKMAVLRALNYNLGKSLESLATYHMDDMDPLTRSDVFLKAAEHYNKADEVVGYMTEFAFRICESYRGAGHYRQKAAALKEKNKDIQSGTMLEREGHELFELSKKIINAYLANNRSVVIIGEEEGKAEICKLKEAVYKKIESDVCDLHFLKVPEKEINDIIRRFA